MNILITGVPGVGKTTVLSRLAERLGNSVSGFITEEVCEDAHRIGFDIVSFDGRRGILARKGIKSPYRVGSYGVELQSFEDIALPTFELVTDKLLIIDEIGKMELFSQRFRDAVTHALDSAQTVIAAIMRKSHPFADAIKKRPDCKLIEVTRTNRDSLPERLIELCGE